MGRNIRMALSVAIYILGLAVSVYVGGWIMLLKPVKDSSLYPWHVNPDAAFDFCYQVYILHDSFGVNLVHRLYCEQPYI